MSASAWSMAGYGTSQTIRFVGNLVLTRLMAPEVFGLGSIVLTFLYGLQMFTDIGSGAAIVQSPRGDDPKFLNTVWTVQCARGTFLFLSSCAIAVPVARFYDQPMLAWLIPAAGAGAVFDGFAATSIQSAARHLQVQWTIFVELTTQVLNILTIVAVAVVLRRAFGPSDLRLVWAIIAGTLVSNVSRLILSHAVVPGIRHRFLIDPDSRRVLFSFGRWVFVSTLLMFLATQSDRLVFAKMIPLDLLGVYGIAAALGSLPAQAVQRLASSVLFPAYSRRHGGDDFHRVFWKARLPVMLSGATLVSGLAACGPFLVRVLYDARYAEAGPILQYLAASAWFQILEATNGAALLAVGRVQWMAWGNAARLVGMIALIPLGFHLGGFRGALLGLVASDVAKYVVSAAGAARCGLSGVGMDTLLSFAALLVAVLAFHVGGLAAVGRFYQLHGFLASGTMAALIWALVGLWYFLRRRRGGGNLA
ncbi:MAG: oligosaccharide flippase family protein [Anaeromyxobacteraceae bacterium]